MPQRLEEIRSWVDSFICAEAPDASIDEDHAALVTDFMTHACDERCFEGKTTCQKGYPQPFNATLTFDADTGFPQYRRRRSGDEYIVPHCAELLKLWRGHIHVDFCASSLMPVYLYKQAVTEEENSRIN